MTAMDAKPLTRFGRIYVAGVSVVGGVLLAQALNDVLRGDLSPNWLVLALLTWASGSFAIKVPAVPATIYISETFVFAMVLLFGPSPAVVTVAIDGALISLRRRNTEISRVLFNVAEPAVSVFAAATAYYSLTGITPFALAAHSHAELKNLLVPVVGMGLVYFLLNSWLTAVAVTSETGMSAYRVWRTHFMWLGLNTLGGASLGLLLAINAPALGFGDLRQLADPTNLSGVGVIVPLLLISYLTFRTSVARVEDANRHLSEMNRLYFSTIETLAMAIDAKDQVTFGHIRRVQNYAVSLARVLGVNSETEVKAIEAAALLHDMGKLSVPEFILNKPGKLTPAEYERIKLHAPVGAEILSQINFPYPVVPIVRHHHENWDGNGYPDGIRGDEIPLGARIMAVVDCYDALTSDRPYRPALAHGDALAIITERRGTMYDPRVVDAFLGVIGEIAPADRHDEKREMASLPWRMPEVPVEADEPPRGLAGSSAEDILLLCDLAEGLAGRATLDDVAEVMSRHLKRMVPAPLVVFYLPDEQSASLVARHASGFGENKLDGLRIQVGIGLSGWVAANRTTIANSNPVLDLRERLQSLSPPLESALSTPLVSEGELVGVLTLYAATRAAFSEDHRRVVELVARQIAPTVARAVRFEQQRTTLLRDRATGLPNARSLEQLIASRGFSDTASMLSFGVLCFAVEEDSAHDANSREQLVLRVADATRKVLRATDLVFRYSDEELVILMPDTDPTVTRRVAQRIVVGLAEGAPKGEELPVQLGIAFAPRDGGSIDDLLKTARGRLERQRWADVVDIGANVAGRPGGGDAA